jgi:uncharacterized RDD family membrane protein YckC
VPGAAQGTRPAGFWVRSVAIIIDGIILVIVVVALWPALFDNSFQGWAEAGEIDGPQFLFSVAAPAVYFTLLTGLWGTTIGKRVFGIWVVDGLGARPSIFRALGRYFATYISTLTLLIGYLMVAFRQDKRALHDLIADTWVVMK